MLIQSSYTTFRVHYPDIHLKGKIVYLRGDNCNLTWNKGVILSQSASNEWSTALLCPENITISVKAMVGESWMIGSNFVFMGGSKQVDIYPCFSPNFNKIVDKPKIHSSILGNTRTVSLYFPPSFYDNTLKQYEVLIMHDGQNLFNNSQAAFGTAWLVQNTIN